MNYRPLIYTLAFFACTPVHDTDDTSDDGGPPHIDRILAAETVSLHRDELGVAHIVAKGDQEAFFALGRASAQDRLFQMDLNRKWAEGRLSELYWQTDGSETAAKLNDKMLKHDRSLRVWGFARRNDALFLNLPLRDKRLLQAYADGVNSVIEDPNFTPPPAYTELGLDTVDPWTPADSLDVWDRMSHLFASNNLDKEITNLLDCIDDDGCTALCNPPIDDSGTVIPTPESSAMRMGPDPIKGGQWDHTVSFKASHGWVIGASRSKTGAPILGLDPKIAITAPSTLYPAHWVTDKHNVWGLSFPGTPAPVLFWNEHLGQSVTAYGGDIADLFELDVISDERYRVDADVLDFKIRTEVILTRDPDVTHEITIRESIFGPVANDLLKTVPAGRTFAVRHLERDRDDNTHSAIAAINASIAKSHREYQAAMDDWLIPGVHAMYGGVDANTGESHIAYYMAGGVPWRTTKYVDGLEFTGRYPYDGSVRDEDWNGRLSITEKPHVVDPEQGYLFAANNLAIGSHYDTVSYVGYPDIGDTYRSYTLRNVFSKALQNPEDKMSLRDVHDVHYEASPHHLKILANILQALADDGRLGRDVDLNEEAGNPKQRAQKVLAALVEWRETDGLMGQTSPYFPLLANLTAGPSGLTTRSRKAYHPEQACHWNEAEGGVVQFFKGFVNHGNRVLDDTAFDFILDVANRAWKKTMDENPTFSINPLEWTQRDPFVFSIAYQNHLGLGNSYSILHKNPGLTATLNQMNGVLINSTKSSTAPATIDFSDHYKDSGFFPPGISEDPNQASFDTMINILEAVSEGDRTAMPQLPNSIESIEARSVSVERIKIQ